MVRFLTCILPALCLFAADPLPSWNDGASKQAIQTFVTAVTTVGADTYVAPIDRIATFDNDGTLWAEQPAYFQLFFVADRVQQLAKAKPEWQTTEPFASVLKGDFKAALSSGGPGNEKATLFKLVAATHANLTQEEFATVAKEWLQRAKHPTTGLPFTGMVYQPMLELIDYLHAKDFKVFIVSGGGIDLMRTFAEEVYQIPNERVIGSSLKSAYQIIDGKPVIMKLPELQFIDDKEAKPVAIQHHIGKRPIFAAGNSDGDFQMLEWTTSGNAPSFGLYVHHTDAKREWAYDRDSHIGQLKRGLDEGPDRGWVFADMAKDWKIIFPNENKEE